MKNVEYKNTGIVLYLLYYMFIEAKKKQGV